MPKFYLNNVEIFPPQNWKELSLELNFDRERHEATQTVSVNTWDFVRENTDKVINHINSGKIGGVGIFEALPFRIELPECGRGIPSPFDGYLDFVDDAKISCIKSSVVAKEREGIDWLNDRADSVSYDYLYSVGKILPTDFKFIPYIINSIPDYKEAALALISVYVISIQISEATSALSQLVIEMANPLEASSIVRAIVLIAYITILIIAIIKLIKDMVQMIIQPVKYHACMNLKTLLEKGAEALEMQFDSPILNAAPFNKATILPEKFFVPTNKSDSRILGITKPLEVDQYGYYKGTFGDLLRACQIAFKAKVVISNGTIYLVRKDKGVTPPQYILPDLYQPEYSYNANELVSNRLVSFEYDISDKNTIQQWTGTSLQVITQPIKVTNPDLVLIKNYTEERIPFALAKRKESLTFPEKVFDAFAKAFGGLINGMIKIINKIIDVSNKVIKTLNKILKALKTVGINLKFEIKPIKNIQSSNLGNIIENRIGMLMIETDQTSKPKIFLMDEGNSPRYNKIAADNSTYISAKYLYNNFMFIDSFIPSADKPTANQYVIKEFSNVPFCCEDYLKVKENNFIFVKGKEAEIESLKWNVYDEVADIRVRIKELYTTNLKEIQVEPTGE